MLYCFFISFEFLAVNILAVLIEDLVLDRARQRAGSIRPGILRFGSVPGLRIRKSGFGPGSRPSYGFWDPEKTRI